MVLWDHCMRLVSRTFVEGCVSKNDFCQLNGVEHLDLYFLSPRLTLLLLIFYKVLQISFSLMYDNST